MEPRIQYAKTSDGVSIAYAVVGEGSDVVYVCSPPFSHAKLIWESFYAHVLPPLANNHRVIWFDWAGTGLSDRDSFDFSLEAMVGVVETVVARMGLERFSMASVLAGVPITLSYAAKWPERVTRLIVADGWAEAADLESSEAFQAEQALRGRDWVIYSETFGRVLAGYEDEQYARVLASYLRACVEPDVHWAAFNALGHYDVSAVLLGIRAPTLVVQNQNSPWIAMRAGRRLASDIPDSRLVVVDDLTYAQLPSLIDDFIGEAESPTAPQGVPSGTAIILFADIADSTALTERLGDGAFRAKAREIAVSLRALIRECAGQPVEGPTLGDGVLAVFTSAREAIAAALACARAGNDAGLPLHLGLHAGDVTREKDPDGRDNVYGGAVNIASRISGLSEPGEVLASETVRSLARTSADVRFDDRGEQALKGVGEPVRVWAVREANH